MIDLKFRADSPMYIDKGDKRFKKYKKQLKKLGFSPSELWGLDETILTFVYPRLKAFAEEPFSHPGNLTYEEWKEILNKMILGIENYLENDNTINEGIELFFKYFPHLWQ